MLILARGDDESPEAERKRSGRPRKGTLGKEDEHPPCSRGRERLFISRHFLGIGAIDEQRPQPSQEGAGEKLRLELLLGDEGGFARDRRRKHEPSR